jgi:hypothetical protein
VAAFRTLNAFVSRLFSPLELGTASHFRNGLRSASEQLFFGFRVAGGLVGCRGVKYASD